MTARYAVYFAPESESRLWRFGTRWLGRDPICGTELAQPRLPGIDQSRIRQVTESPRHYGFHATLKAPFELVTGMTRSDLEDAIRQFAASRAIFQMGPLRLADLGGFLALMTGRVEPALQALADGCVRAFDMFRAPSPKADLQRRQPDALTPRQRDHLDQWGYPFVFEDFRFHMTLTCRLDQPERARFLEKLRSTTDELIGDDNLPVNSVCLYEQPDPATPFRLTGRYALG